jgi:predicted permease
VLHLLLVKSGKFPLVEFKGSFLTIYFFVTFLSLATFWFVYSKFKKDHTAAGRAFFVAVFVKIISSAVFLYPGVVTQAKFAKQLAAQFLPVFFILLFVETILLIRLLNKPSGENSKNDENQ